jgi:ABC-2 type transport system permease protein
MNAAVAELAKLPAFVRRDLRIMLSYRMAAFTGLVGIAAQAIAFSFIGKLINPAQLPSFGSTHATYMQFVTIGIALNMIVALMLHQLAMAIRTEQLMGTLESLLLTPTKITTIQAGSAAFELLYVPLRMGVFVTVIGFAFGLHFHAGGILAALVILVGFLPFLWGLGLLSAGAILTFRRGAGAVAAGGTALGLASGAFFPLSVLPPWLHTIANANPLAIAIHALREALIGGTGLASVGSDLLELAPLSILALGAGILAFRLALARERRNGTLGLY